MMDWSTVDMLTDMYSSVQARIIRDLSKDLTAWSRARMRAKLEEVNRILEALDRRTLEWARTEIPGFYTRGVILADRYVGAGTYGSVHQETVTRLARGLVRGLAAATEHVGLTVNDIFRSVSTRSLAESMISGETPRQAAKRIVSGLTKNGVEAFTDKAGRNWSLESYSRMVVRTTSREANTQGVINRLVERGRDLVEVSSHGGSCELCAPWDGAILSISGDSEHPSLAEAEADGLFHPNCAHVIVPYVP